MNIYPISNKTDHFLEKYIFIEKKSKTKVGIPSILGRNPDPDPFFHETDPRIRVRFFAKRILGSGSVFSSDPDPFFHETDPRIRIRFFLGSGSVFSRNGSSDPDPFYVFSFTKRILGSGSVFSRNGSENPDPYQNATDPQHCFPGLPRQFE